MIYTIVPVDQKFIFELMSTKLKNKPNIEKLNYAVRLSDHIEIRSKLLISGIHRSHRGCMKNLKERE